MSNNLIEAYEVVEGSDVDLKLEVEFGHMAVTDIYLEHVKIVSGKLGNISLSPLMPGSELKGKTLHFSTMVTIYTRAKRLVSSTH